jgi:hypothetical protein
MLTLTVAGGGVEVGGFTVTVAYAFESGCTALWAVTITAVGLDTGGAVRRPFEIEPALVDHTTDVLLVPLTVAENCCVPADGTVALVGFRLTVMLLVGAGGFTVTVAEAFESTEAALVAVTVTVVTVETVGAVSTPVLEIEPALVDQITLGFVEPLTVAENCCVPPEMTVALAGEI